MSIFVTYSHRDHDYLSSGELLGFLRGLEGDSDVHFWYDEKLSVGTRWDEEIRARMEQAHIALVLVSQAFLDSAYCRDVELARFLERRRKEGLRIFPIILSACEWERHAWLSEHQGLPTGGETLEEHYLEPGHRKRMYLRIRKELRDLVEQVRQTVKPVNGHESASLGAAVLAERRRVTLLECAAALQDEGDSIDSADEAELLYEAAPLFRDCVVAQVQALDGHVVCESPGGMLACFGYPAIHEDDAIRAIRTGLGIVQTVHKLSGEFKKLMGVGLTARVGVHTGVVISSTGAVAHSEMQRGETRLIASLLQAGAPPGGLVVGDSTAKLIRGFFQLGASLDLEHPALRRKVRGREVLADLGSDSRFYAARSQGLLPMVGRDRELSIILEAWAGAETSSGRMALITADAGVGKSRLLEEARRSIVKCSSYVIECQCSPQHQNSTLFPVARALRKWLNLQPGEASDIQRRKLEIAVGRAGLKQEEVTPFLADLLGIASPDPAASQLSAKQQKEGTFYAILMWIAKLAAEKPVLLAMEDLHWMDASTGELLSSLLDELAQLPVLVVATARKEYHPPASWMEREEFLPVKIGPLSTTQVKDMVLRLSGGKPLPDEVTAAICKKTEGCPLFVEDLTHMVLESDLLEEREAAYVSRREFQPLTIPDTLADALMARLSRVEGARIVAQLGALIGREFTFEMIESIAPMDSSLLKESLGKLVSAGVLQRRGLMTREQYVFRHAIEQDVLYQSLLTRERKQFHKKIAEAIEARLPAVAKNEPELMAHHFREAGVPEIAVKYMIAAGDAAIRNCAHIEAIAHARNAMAIIGKILDTQQRARLELRVRIMEGPALLAVKGWAAPELGAVYERAKELLPYEDDPAQRFRITRGLWGYYMVSAQLETSLQLSRELMEFAEASNSDDYRLEAHVTFCDSYFWMGRPALSAEHAEQGLALYSFERHHTAHSLEYGEDPSVIFHCYGALSHWLLGHTARAEELVAEAKATVERYTHLFSRGFLLNGIAWYYSHTGNPALARHYGLALLQLSTEHDFAPWRALARTHCGWAAGAMGEVESGALELCAGMVDLQSVGIVITKLLNYVLLAGLFQQAGQYTRALDCVAHGLAQAAQTEERHYLSELNRLRAELLALTAGSSAEIQSHYQQAILIACEQQALTLEQKAAASRLTKFPPGT